MRHIGVVARILHDRRQGATRHEFGLRQSEGGRLATGQADRHRIGEGAMTQRGIGGLGRRRGTGAGGPAAPQGLALIHAYLGSAAARRAPCPAVRP